jgi:hypothetical protein
VLAEFLSRSNADRDTGAPVAGSGSSASLLPSSILRELAGSTVGRPRVRRRGSPAPSPRRLRDVYRGVRAFPAPRCHSVASFLGAIQGDLEVIRRLLTSARTPRVTVQLREF